jgi:diguanylate cyclase (GGDEF)-like protein
MMTPLRLLLIEDSEDDAALVVQTLSAAGYEVSSTRVDTASALTATLEAQRWDLTIGDYSMAPLAGTEALALVRKYDAEMPFIFVSETVGEDAAVAAMKSGAHDYIMKSNLKRLVPAVERELREAANRLSRRQAEARLAHLAYHDILTDLPNRVLLQDRLQQAVLAAQRAGTPLALIVLDLDGFKTINDSLGHDAGDRALQQVASRLRGLLRESDTVARLGGDEFAMMLPMTDIEGAGLTANKILHELHRPLLIDGRPLGVTGSLGIACFPEHGAKAETLLQKADIAMYVAKSGGFGYAVYSPDRDRHAHQRLTRMTEVREGIDREQFFLEYQPIVDLQTGRVVCVEGLARWHHPRQGRLPPIEFIQLAEQTGLIEPLTMLLLDKALAEWSGSRRMRVPVAVNLSPRNLRDPDLPDRIAERLRLHGVPPSALVLEITENLIVSDPFRASTCLTRLHDMGVSLAIDDFGTGYSSLSNLRRLPVDELKIDRSFVVGLAAGDDAIVRSTIDLAHNLGLTVVAEGVETEGVRNHLRGLGCDAAQGILIRKPAAATGVRRWVAQQNAADERHP